MGIILHVFFNRGNVCVWTCLVVDFCVLILCSVTLLNSHEFQQSSCGVLFPYLESHAIYRDSLTFSFP